MAEEKESSVLFSLKELMSLEEDRIAKEEADAKAREDAARRAREDAERAAREAEELRLREEEERRRQEEARRREEEARVEALKQAEIERARAEQEQKARMEALSAQQEHERRLAELNRDKGKKKLKIAATMNGRLPSASALVRTLSGWFVRKVRNFMAAELSRSRRRPKYPKGGVIAVFADVTRASAVRPEPGSRMTS